ncbi:retrotransposon protein, putative, ty1-copia subclass [Tanacetum coccineum]|uniref:Retrotransposon protein, putative, ty1-copia subclass n=1 Tax=Tanacetum coccineum TaxID=301880 RepID=A0ABQ4XQP7_9ASTR
MGNNVTMLKEVKSWLCKCFSMKDLGVAAYILGIKIIRDRSKWLIALSQSAYLQKILKKFRMENSKKGYTPIMEKPDYRKSQGAKTPTKVQRMQRVPYASAIGSIMNTKDMVLVYGAKPKDELKVSCYADAKAEYITAAEALMEVVWVRKFIDGLRGVMSSNKRPMEMLCDNEPALAIASDPEILKGARHFQKKYHYIHEVIQEGEIVLKKVHTDDNVANPFTKSMSFSKHFEHAMAIGIIPAIWMRKFIDGLGGVMPSNKRPMEMLCDNEHALAIASDPEILMEARHFQRKYHYIHEVIQEGKIILKKVHRDDNVANPFTKSMPFSKHSEHAMAIGIIPASSLM